MAEEIANSLELRVVDLINQERARAGLDPVHVEVHLNSAARIHSEYMAEQSILTHTGPNNDTVSERALSAFFPMASSEYWRLTENVGYTELVGPADEKEVYALHTALMNSASHRANILDGDVNYIGVSLEEGSMNVLGTDYDVLFVTQNFGRTNLPVDVQETNADGETVITQYLNGEPVEGTSTPVDDGDGDEDGSGDEDPSDPSNPDEEDEQDPETGSGGGCFVATAAYGNRLHPDVVALRKFRDTKLIHSKTGRIFIKTYWRVGPVLARVVRHDKMSGKISRKILSPLSKFLSK